MQRQRSINSILVALAVGVLIFFVLFPLVWILLMSFKTPRELIAYPPLFIFKPTLENYGAVLGLDVATTTFGITVDFIQGYKNSLVICIGALIISVAVSMPAAYALARYEFPFKERLAFVFLGFRFVPDMALIIPLYVIFLRLGLYDTPLGLMLSYQSFMVPFMIWTMRSYFQDVPREVEEAAAVDGCSSLKVFRHVTLPLAAPGLAATAALVFIFAWNNFSFGLVLSQINAQPVTVTMLGYITYTATLWGQLAAAAVLIIVPELFIGIFIQRYIVQGLTYGIH